MGHVSNAFLRELGRGAVKRVVMAMHIVLGFEGGLFKRVVVARAFYTGFYGICSGRQGSGVTGLQISE